MPVGYLTTVFILAICVSLQLWPPRRSQLLGVLSFWAGLFVNEQPHWFAALLVGASILALGQGDINSPPGWLALAVAGASILGLMVLLSRSFRSRRELRDAVSVIGSAKPRRLDGRGAHAVSLLLPLAFGRSGVERVSDIVYGPAPGRANRLDLYRPREPGTVGPTLIYFHGGRFRSGDKKREAQAMKWRLARRGWTVISANYRLNPEGSFPDYLVDLKRVIAWVRREGVEFGLDRERLFLAGGSAGAHIAAMAGLTPNMPELQPGFAEVETSVSGVIGLYGYYGGLDAPGSTERREIATSPLAHVNPEAPPFLLIHGSNDTLVPARGALALAEALSAQGGEARLAMLPGAQHTFDLLRSVRTDNAIDAIEDFADQVVTRSDPSCRNLL